MYPYIIMKLSKKKIQKLYKSKNQTRKSGGKKSFTPKQTNHRSRKAGALNLRKRTIRKMKGGVPNEEGGKEDNELPPAQVVGEGNNPPEAQQVRGVVEAPEEKIEITENELEDVFEGFTKAREGENKESVVNKIIATDDDKAKEEKIVSFNNLSTYKEFMTKLANLMLGKLNEVYNKKISDMKEEIFKNIKEKPVDSEVVEETDLDDAEGEAVDSNEGDSSQDSTNNDEKLRNTENTENTNTK